MAYNNYFPATYQPQYYYPQQQMQQQQAPVAAQPNNGIIWVQGEAGAKSYLVAPNNTVPLWDSEAQTIYLKSADASGMPSMKIVDYTIRDTAPVVPVKQGVAYATKDELEKLREEVKKLMEARKDESVISAADE